MYIHCYAVFIWFVAVMEQYLPKPGAKQPNMSDAEREALAKKLDDELEDFMLEMAEKRRMEGGGEKKEFDFDEWCKEIDQHPAFMTDLSAGMNGKYKDVIEGLQAMKYEEGAEDNLMTAEKAKIDGNKHFQYKKYRWAIDCYTQGIKAKCLDRKLNGILYCNRAASNRHIGNLRSAIKDCTMGVRFDPTNLKGVIRGAECMMELGYGSQAASWLDKCKAAYVKAREELEQAVAKAADEPVEADENGVFPEPPTLPDDSKSLAAIEELAKKAKLVVEQEQKNERKRRVDEKKEIAKKKMLLDALKERKLNLRPRVPFDHPELFEWGLIEVQLAQLKDHARVDFDEEGNLQWPLLLQYPQTGQTDVLTECNETVMAGTLLKEVLAEPAEWDKDHKFNMDNVRLFVCSEWDEWVQEVYPWTDFKTMCSLPHFQIRHGLPVLMVYTKDYVDDKFTMIGDNKYTVN